MSSSLVLSKIIMRKFLFSRTNKIRNAISIAKRFCHSGIVSHPVERLVERAVVRATGQDVISYLQGLTTADVDRLNTRPVVYTMFLNSKGRILFDALVHKSGEGVLIECHKDVSNKLLNHLNLFKVRRKIDLIIDNEMKVLVGDLKDRGAVDDPRDHRLGQRMVSLENAPSSPSSYHTTRYSLGIAEGPSEIPTGNCFPLEYNLEWLNGVSFDKGLFLPGPKSVRESVNYEQKLEPVLNFLLNISGRFSGVVRKRIMPLTLIHTNDEISLGDSVVDVETGKAIGSVRGVLGCRILALMRVKETLTSKRLQVRNTDANVIVPDWWPKDFYK